MPRRRGYAAVPQQTIVPSAARTTTSTGTAVKNWARDNHVAKLNVTAASGTSPQLTVTIQDSPDGTTWTTRDTFGVKTGVSNEVRPVPKGLDTFQRAAWTIAGTTPSFTFDVQFASSSLTLV